MQKMCYTHDILWYTQAYLYAKTKLYTGVYFAYKYRNPYGIHMIYIKMMYTICTPMYYGTYTYVIHRCASLKACVYHSIHKPLPGLCGQFPK